MIENKAGSPRRQFIPRDELLAAFKGAPTIDLTELRAESDAYVDPCAWGWDDWEAWADRHLGRDSPRDDQQG
jgi:hypothetical protein